jgi:hypothetical protein
MVLRCYAGTDATVDLTKIADNWMRWRQAPGGLRVSALVSTGADSGPRDGAEHGTHDGGQVGADNVPDLGFRVARRNGVVVDVAIGEPDPVGPEDHADAFLLWLQSTELAGEWVARSLLQKLYVGLFMADVMRFAGWTTEPWPSVAHQLRKLPGVKTRLLDGRKGHDRKGASRTVYWIPARRRA